MNKKSKTLEEIAREIGRLKKEQSEEILSYIVGKLWHVFVESGTMTYGDKHHRDKAVFFVTTLHTPIFYLKTMQEIGLVEKEPLKYVFICHDRYIEYALTPYSIEVFNNLVEEGYYNEKIKKKIIKKTDFKIRE
ncbi:MAG: hypothetical protein AABW57_02360 [Nanoarchaeota archaeon]